jgi:hypothetical protein
MVTFAAPESRHLSLGQRRFVIVSDVLPLDLDEPTVAVCWYCGTTAGDFETEHQTPKSRGGTAGSNVVRACVPCNHLKGKLTLEEFRTALELRLGVSPVVFAGEATTEIPATAIGAVRSLAGTQAVVKLDPVVAERLDRALLWLGRRGRGRPTRKNAVSAAVTAWLDELSAAELDGEDFPSDPMLPLEGLEPRPIVRPGEASQTPRLVWDRQVTKVGATVLEQARRAVRFLAPVEGPISLVDFVTGAVADRLDSVENRYPRFGPLRAEPLTSSSGLGVVENEATAAGPEGGAG